MAHDLTMLSGLPRVKDLRTGSPPREGLGKRHLAAHVITPVALANDRGRGPKP
jgi:hypothetical protein